MGYNNRSVYIRIAVTLCAFWLAVGQLMAQMPHKIGDLYTFPDGDRGVVFYIDPDNPYRGTVMALQDVSTEPLALWKSQLSVSTSPFNAMVKTPETFFRYDDTVTVFHGKQNTKLLVDAGQCLAFAAFEEQYYKGWYIPDVRQLWRCGNLSAAVRRTVTDNGGSWFLARNTSDYYWTSSLHPDGNVRFYSIIDGQFHYTENSDDPQNPSRLHYIRLVRDFYDFEAVAYWDSLFEQDGTITNVMHVSPVEATDYAATVKYGDTAFHFSTSVNVNTSYHSDTIYEVTCVRSGDSAYYVSSKLPKIFNPDVYGNIDVTKEGVNDYTYHLASVNGCDSTVTLVLQTVSCQQDAFFFSDSICRGEITEDGYVILNKNQDVSEFVDRSEVTVDPKIEESLTGTGLYEYQGTMIQEGISDTVPITIYFDFTVFEESHSDLYWEDVCNSFTWNDSVYTQSGDYIRTFTNANGCDSVVTLHLTLSTSDTTRISMSVCDSLVWYDDTLTRTDEYKRIFSNAAGCDSVVILSLKVNSSPQVTLHDTSVCYNSKQITLAPVIKQGSCSAMNYKWTGSASYVTNDDADTCTVIVPENLCSGQYRTTFEVLDTNNCRATAQCIISWESVQPAITTTLTNPTFIECSNHTFPTVNDFTVSDECHADAVVTLRAEEEQVNGCHHYQSWVATYSNDCYVADSVVITYQWREPVENPVPAMVSSCESYVWNGTTYTESGQYSKQLSSVCGCDSLVALNLTIRHGTHNAESREACESYYWHSDSPNGAIYTTSGTYTYDYTNAEGCPSTDTLHLTIGHATHETVTVDACDSYEWHGTPYTFSGTYTYDYTNASGCPGTDTLHLTVKPYAHYEFSVTTCDIYSWNDVRYDESGDYVQTFTSANECDSVVTLHLTLYYDTTTVWSDTACETFTWNDSVYTQSGEYIQQFSSIHGCDSTVTLQLTINHATAAIDPHEACNTFTWDGVTYTESTDTPTVILTNAVGCDSAVTLNLTVFYSDTTEDFATNCYSYTWNDSTYTQTGDYVQTLTNIHGCDSVVTLHLIINDTIFHQFSDESCNSYTWNDSTYYVSGGRPSPPLTSATPL